ncbi:MAG: hypothetical protein J0H49_11205 [Acidobacteria bacterium]|nr:hypothetical protein [Acidobacteriota bacterium]
MKITAVLIVEAIEPCLTFWVDRLGFEKTVEVPEGDRLGFVILQKDSAELMFQTRDSVAKDVPQMIPAMTGQGVGLFIEVPDFDDLLSRVAGMEVVMPERTAFYGMREIVVREPGGFAVCFASRVEAANA